MKRVWQVLLIVLILFLLIGAFYTLFQWDRIFPVDGDNNQLRNIASNLCNPKQDSRLVYICGDYVQVTPDYESGIVGGMDDFYFSNGDKLTCCFTCGPSNLDPRCWELVDEKCIKEKIC